MFSKKNLQHIATIFLIFIILFSTLSNQSLAQNSSAYNGVRNTTGENCDDAPLNGEVDRSLKCYTSDYNKESELCKKPELKFEPYFDNVDRDWNMGNDACLGYMLGAGAALQAAFIGCRVLCPTPPATNFREALRSSTQSKFDEMVEPARKAAEKAQTVATPVANAGQSQANAIMMGMPIDPFLLYDLANFGGRCAGGVEAANCCPAFFACTAATGVAIGILASIWAVSKDGYEKTTICGNGWKVWKRDNNASEWKSINGNYALCLKTIFGTTSYCAPGTTAASSNSNCTNPNIALPNCSSKKNNKSNDQYCKFTNNKQECNITNVGDRNKKEYSNIHYREFIFQGIEYVDHNKGGCADPNPQDSAGKDKWKEILGYDPGGKQRYYFRGSNQIPNFACKRFLENGFKDEEGLKAFACCNEKSQKTICLERFDNPTAPYKFCRRGEQCTTFFHLAGLNINYKIFESERSPNYICAKTYSTCPYDHNLQGGTDNPQFFYNNPRIISNFCQYMNHCIKLPPISKYSYFDPDTFFFAESCKDLRGDSQFFNESEIGKLSKYSSMYSRNFSAPIVQCFKETLENNFMQKAGKTICINPDEIPKKTKANPDGECTSGYVQHKGANVNQTFFKRVQTRFLIPIKIALVLSVVIFGFNTLLATPESFINKKTIMTYLVKFGLVFFFVVGNAWQGFFMDSVMNLSSEFANITFSPKSTRDTSSGDDGCYFPKYNYLLLLEDEPQKELKTKPSYPIGKDYLRIWDTLDCKIARAIGYGPDVTVPNLAKMIFAGFISGSLGIAFFFAAFAYGVMLFSIAMRAIHITIMSIMGVILLIYVSPLTITCVLFERTKGIFENWWKQMLGFILQPMILFAYLGLLLTVFDDLFIGDAKFITGTNGLPAIDCNANAVANTNPNENSVYCILNLAKYKNYTGLELFDLALPVLTSLNKEKINTLSRAAIIMFVFLKFLDKISTVAKKLVGGVELKADSTSELQNQLKKAAKGVQTRALNTTSRFATKQVPNFIKNKIRPESDSPPPKPKNGNAKKTEGGGSSPAGGGDSAGGGATPPAGGGGQAGGGGGIAD